MASHEEWLDPSLVGKVVEFRYPTSNYAGVRRQRLESRMLRVEKIRLPDEQPLRPRTFEIEPNLQRTGALLTGIDLMRGSFRSFWSGSMREVRVLPASKLEGEARFAVITLDGERVDRIAEEFLTLESAATRAVAFNRLCSGTGSTAALVPQIVQPLSRVLRPASIA